MRWVDEGFASLFKAYAQGLQKPAFACSLPKKRNFKGRQQWSGLCVIFTHTLPQQFESSENWRIHLWRISISPLNPIQGFTHDNTSQTSDTGQALKQHSFQRPVSLARSDLIKIALDMLFEVFGDLLIG